MLKNSEYVLNNIRYLNCNGLHQNDKTGDKQFYNSNVGGNNAEVFNGLSHLICGVNFSSIGQKGIYDVYVTPAGGPGEARDKVLRGGEGRGGEVKGGEGMGW